MRRWGSGAMLLALTVASILPAGAQQRSGPARGDIVVTGRPDQAVAKWVRAESPNFTVYGRDETETRGMTARLERFDRRVS